MVKRRRKNFFPTLIAILFFWTTLAIMVWLIEPALVKDFPIPNLYLPFFLNFFLALFLTLAVILANSRRGLLIASGITLFLVLRLHQLGNILNALLIISLIIALEYYFTRR